MRAREAYIGQKRDKEPEAYRAYQESLRALPEDVSGIEGRIGLLRLFPGKALGELFIDQVKITEYGLQSHDPQRPHVPGFPDRAFMLGIKNRKPDNADKQYLRFSQRDQSELVLVKPRLEGDMLTYSAPGMDDIAIALSDVQPRTGDQVTVDVAGDIVRAVPEGGLITARIRQFLRQFRSDVDDIEVLLPSLDYQRIVEEQHRCGQEGQTLFTDGGQELLGSVASLDFLNARIRARNGEDTRQVPMEAFRPNFEVEGWPANLEDVLLQARIEGMSGDVAQRIDLLFGNLSIRCSVTMVDTQTGQKHEDGEPLGTANVARPKRLSGSKIPTFAVNTVFPKSEWGKVIRKGSRIVAVSEKEFDC